jgi:putative PEP-CTERM system histidine kinase
MAFGLVSHSAAFAAYILLIALLVVSWRKGGLGAWLVVACGLTALWAAAVAYDEWAGISMSSWSWLMEGVRTSGWLTFMASVLAVNRRHETEGSAPRLLLPVVVAYCAVLVGHDILTIVVSRLSSVIGLALFIRLVGAVIGLALVENLYRNTPTERRWSVKYLCFAIGGMFVFDLFIYADAMLFQRLDANLLDARGATSVLLTPLIAIAASRNPQWSLDVFVSRRVVFHSTTLIAAGLYLLLMAAAGYYLREFGGGWGSVLQITFLFGSIILLAVILTSGRVRSYVAVLLNKHFFRYKYDYRVEWLRFIDTISAHDRIRNLHARAIQAAADVVDSPEGGLWLAGENGDFRLVREWNRRIDPLLVEPAGGALAEFFRRRNWVLNLDESEDNDAQPKDLDLPAWLAGLDWAWLVLPLAHRGRLLGFIILSHPRAHRTLNWEDYDLLKTLSQQIASYLREQESEKALLAARQFESFNRRFAFVVHDIKNLVSQLSLLVSNADKHADNPAFRQDMIDTVRDSVEKMNILLDRLHKGWEPDLRDTIDLAGLLEELTRRYIHANPAPTLDICPERPQVTASKDQLFTVLSHLLDNAVSAAPDTGSVILRLHIEGESAVIDVTDDGEGMDAGFVRDQLFQPFRSTKSGGYGIGAYESRQIIGEMGGRLDVISRPGEGTTMRIILPFQSSSLQPREPSSMAEVV